MAAVSAPQATGALTPPTSSDGNSSAWDFSVPSRNQHSTFPRQQHEETSHSERKPMTSHPNGSTRRNDTAKLSRSTPTSDPAYLAPARLNSLNKNGNISETNSPSDSLLDLYSGKSAASSIDHSERGRDASNDALDNEDDPGWIHRDKLARIESRELQAAGIIIPRTRAYSRRERSREPSATGLHRNEQHPAKHQRVDSAPAEVLEDEEGTTGWDPRSPEEIAADNSSSHRDYGSLSKGSSKIPLALTSPAPIPWEYLERDAPMQRSRSAVWSGEDDSIAYNPRTKASSEDPPALPPTPSASRRLASTDSSPKKSANATPTTRKTSSASANATTRPPQTQQNQKAKTRSSSNSRPPTRSGETAAKSPEGDPPWLASMYKPDPRLPPDQQLLPTVARRLQQEQWEKEGKFGNTYDREFRPLNDDEIKMPEPAAPPATGPEEPEKPEEKAEDLLLQWPLKKERTPEPSRPGTAGGYSTVPRIQNVPPTKAQSPRVAQNPVRPPVQEEAPEKRGCGCCIVM